MRERTPSAISPIPLIHLDTWGCLGDSCDRNGIDIKDARIGQYDKCSEGVLLLPNILKTKILVIGNMYRYIGDCLLGVSKPIPELIFRI